MTPGRAALRFVGVFPLREAGFPDVFEETAFSDLPGVSFGAEGLGFNIRVGFDSAESGLACFAVSSRRTALITVPMPCAASR